MLRSGQDGRISAVLASFNKITNISTVVYGYSLFANCEQRMVICLKPQYVLFLLILSSWPFNKVDIRMVSSPKYAYRDVGDNPSKHAILV